ncbi:ATP-binding cassette domain-containing protein [Nonomuraea glycinis]|nr:ATP-binding cassette domain-containing protein [Nonomuraea glycinis]
MHRRHPRLRPPPGPGRRNPDCHARGDARPGLAGPSGCGTSTLACVLPLLLRPSGGTVSLDGQPITRWRHRARQRTSIDLIFQQPARGVRRPAPARLRGPCPGTRTPLPHLRRDERPRLVAPARPQAIQRSARGARRSR